jgi:pyridoxamine 5'-phosphate oxidase family protein
MTFTDGEIEYLGTQRLGRLATVDAGGRPQNNPVGFVVNTDTGTIDIGGWNLAASRKFANARAHPAVAFVVDDIASFEPWVVRGVEIRGEAEAVTGQPRPEEWMSGELIRIHPRRILTWGLIGMSGMARRTVG